MFIQPESTNKPPAYPTSAKKKTDWNEIEKPVAEEQPEGDAALNARIHDPESHDEEFRRKGYRSQMKKFLT